MDKSDVVIIGGYKYEMLEGLHSQILVNNDWASTNIMGSLMLADEFLRSEQCAILYSDVLFDAKDLLELCRAPGAGVLSVRSWKDLWMCRFSEPLSDLERFEFSPQSGHLTDIGGRAATTTEIQGQFAGIWKCTPDLWTSLSAGVNNLQNLDTTSALKWAITNGYVIDVVLGSGEWFEIDQPTDLEGF